MRPIRNLPKEKDYLAPDGSEIRLLAEGTRGGLAHCTLPAGKTSTAHVHKIVDEIWYLISGVGQVWLRSGRQEQMLPQNAMS
jgi:mannose-6-phosphate isomerase-like protein (cupin superfamily)